MTGYNRGSRQWRGSSGHRRTGSSPGRSVPKNPCRYFHQHGSCRFGSNCKFSHDPTPVSRQPQSQTNQRMENDRSRSEYHEWKQLIWKKRILYPGADTFVIARVWSGAVDILNGDGREWHQQLIKDMVDGENSGLTYMNWTLDIRIGKNHAKQLEYVDDFLRTITHPSLLDCLSVDSYVGTLYNIISGVNGQKAVTFFLNLCQDILNVLDSAESPIDTDAFDQRLMAILDALYQLLAREKTASFNDELPGLFACLDRMFGVLDKATSATARRYGASKDRLAVLRRMVDMSNGLLSDPALEDEHRGTVFAVAKTPAVALAYPIQMPLPGTRHDNDHRDIKSISIVPTAAELATDQPDYLPSTDWGQPHFLDDLVQRHIDTHFRLLRHDIFGSLKAAVSPLIQTPEAGLDLSRLPRDLAMHFYQQASVPHISVHEKRGYEVHVSFLLPQSVRSKKAEERRQWWMNSKRLEPGSLACLLCQDGPRIVPLLLVVTEKGADSKEKKTVGHEAKTVQITAKLAAFREADLKESIRIYREKAQGVLFGDPGLIPATFMPILENLQRMIGAAELPFRRWIVPDRDIGLNAASQGAVANPPPPRYARRPGFTFPLNSIVKAGGANLSISPEGSPDDASLVDQVESSTTLDRGQCRALLYALTREFALIQGPPGTGKSYLGVKLLQVLVGCKGSAALSGRDPLGPIIVICYTNHALDQFLSHLLSVGISKIIRIGGRSQSAALDGYNLHTICNNIPKTRHEGYLVGSAYSSLEHHLEMAGKKLGMLHKMRKGSASEALERFLEMGHPKIHSQLYQDQSDGFTMVGRSKNPLGQWVNVKKWRGEAKDVPSEADEATVGALLPRAEEDVNSLSPAERRVLLNHWNDRIQRDEVTKLMYNIENAESDRESVNRVHSEVRRRALLSADVVGITTTGLAKDMATIRNLRPKVVVFEEAGEVLEAHALSALMPGVEHFIQIGDHQQLRPQITNFSLSLESAGGKLYQLDRSQFERLAGGQPGLAAMPVAQLDVQRRMRPDISRLIRSTIYPGLQDHCDVATLPDVVGMRDNVVWLDHENGEDSGTDNGRVRSHSNEWEVAMTKALVRHLIRQGAYEAHDVAVLTPYSGQLTKLRTALNQEFDISLSDRDEETLAKDGFEPSIDANAAAFPARRLQKKRLGESLRLATVDNFQGEEAKVIIVSLVRSNPQGKVGFLKTRNRINVLLSRAQHGMYLIGNARTYGNVPMWADVQRQLSEARTLGPALRLCCQRHRDTTIECAEPEDFPRLSPEGGCLLPCEWRLDACGHQCLAKCHSKTMHAVFSCPRECPRRRTGCDHPCPKLCGEECGPCRVVVDDVRLPCGHVQDGMACFRAQKAAEIQCTAQVEVKVPSCGHVVKIHCFMDVSASGFVCSQPCDEILACGHVCPGTCGTCKTRGLDGAAEKTHKVCQKTCSRPRNTCTHLCAQKCHDGKPCPPCEARCEVRCAHSRCALSCQDACPPCIEKCSWSCEHQGSCSMPCAAPCDRLPCDERCSQLLGCGHRCPGLCGEKCPQGYCQDCGDRGDDRVDLLELETYARVDLNKTPIVVLGCGHFFTAESLDGLARMCEVYSADASGRYTGLLEPSEAVPVPRCPDCKRPIRQFTTQRYNRVVNAGVMDETSKRFLVKGQRDLIAVEEDIKKAAKALRGSFEERNGTSRGRILPRGPNGSIHGQTHLSSGAYTTLQALQRQVVKLRQSTDVMQQPSKKLFDAILEAKTRRPLDSKLENLSLNGFQSSPPERQVVLGAQFAGLRIRAIILQDRFRLHAAGNELQGGPKPDNHAYSFMAACESFVAESSADNFPRFSIGGILAFASITASLRDWSRKSGNGMASVSPRVEMAKMLLEQAQTLCQTPFEGAQKLREEVEAAQRIFDEEWYETVTPEELAAIKGAMLGGSLGMATHSGHWYKCSNGHLFAIGECGMPMEEARCPECGARIGGRSHQMVSGVSRAEEME